MLTESVCHDVCLAVLGGAVTRNRNEFEMREFDDDDVVSSPYSRKVGDRLRVIRRQKRLSLQEVEATSHEEFKASVLGAYERGERAISVPRLERLAKFYNVPVDQLLPREDVTPSNEAELPASKKLAVDLLKLTQLTGQPFEMLARFLKMIQVQRQDFNGKVITAHFADFQALRKTTIHLIPTSNRAEQLAHPVVMLTYLFLQNTTIPKCLSLCFRQLVWNM